MSARVLVPTMVQRVSPWRSGRKPTRCVVFRLSPVPIRNSVTVRPLLPSWLRALKAWFQAGNTVFSRAARQKIKMNHGHWMRALDFNVRAVTKDRGTIQSERASLMVVPTANAVGPYLAVAPTTELVSWIANADQSPNWAWVMCSRDPMKGKRNNATELRMNTDPKATAISSSLASAIGPTAAMALPPQIAVPALIRNAGFLPTWMRQPSPKPSNIATVMLAAV